MKAQIDSDLFSDPQKSMALIGLAFSVFNGRHRIEIMGDGRHLRDWLSRQDDTIRETWELILDEGVRLEASAPSLLTIRVRRDGPPDWSEATPSMGLDDAFGLLNQPFRVLIENARNDRAFLLRLASPAQRRILKKAETDGWLCFEGAGGIGELKMLLNGPIYGIPSGRMTSWIAHDSDALRPGKPSKDAIEIEQLCKSKRLPHFRLARRAIENYIPVPSIVEWASRSPKKQLSKARAFGRLTEAQRAHFNMKAGFAGDAHRAAEVGDLFDGIPADKFATLRAGFGPQIAGIYEDEELVSDHHEDEDGRKEIHQAIGLLIGLVS